MNLLIGNNGSGKSQSVKNLCGALSDKPFPQGNTLIIYEQNEELKYYSTGNFELPEGFTRETTHIPQFSAVYYTPFYEPQFGPDLLHEEDSILFFSLSTEGLIKRDKAFLKLENLGDKSEHFNNSINEHIRQEFVRATRFVSKHGGKIPLFKFPAFIQLRFASHIYEYYI